jgi:hypothetical protein
MYPCSLFRGVVFGTEIALTFIKGYCFMFLHAMKHWCWPMYKIVLLS